MPDNPFKPPDAELRDPPPRPGSPALAVVAGLVVDIGGSLVCAFVLQYFYIESLQSSGMSADDIAAALGNLPPTSPVLVLGMLLGSLCSVAGGFVCARVARVNEYRVGGIMAVLSAFLGELLGERSGGDTAPDMRCLLALTTVACVLLGAKYGRALNVRRREAPPR